MSKGTRKTDWQTGDVVRTVRDTRDISHPEALPAGIVAKLGRLYRIQDGFEVWGLWVTDGLRCVTHADVERAYGPVAAYAGPFPSPVRGP